MAHPSATVIWPGLIACCRFTTLFCSVLPLQDEPQLLRSLYPRMWQQRSSLWRAAVQLQELWRPRWAPLLRALWPRVAESLDVRFFAYGAQPGPCHFTAAVTLNSSRLFSWLSRPSRCPPARDSMTSSTDDTCTNDRAAVKAKWRS